MGKSGVRKKNPENHTDIAIWRYYSTQSIQCCKESGEDGENSTKN
jgi:hypothetical protein